MPYPICDACETVAHCLRNGCIPLCPLPGAADAVVTPPQVVLWQYRTPGAAGRWHEVEDYEAERLRAAGYAVRSLGVIEQHDAQ